jgi:hypothetical protein
VGIVWFFANPTFVLSAYQNMCYRRFIALLRSGNPMATPTKKFRRQEASALPAHLSVAMVVARAMMMEGNLQAMDRLIELARELDRYHGLAAAPISEGPPPRLVSRELRPRLTISTRGEVEGKFSASQTFEIPRNAEGISQTAPPHCPAAPGPRSITPNPARGGRRDRGARGGRQDRVAGKWRRNALNRLNPRRKMVWARQPRTYKIWYTGARLMGGNSGVTKLQKKAPNALKSLDAELKSAPATNTSESPKRHWRGKASVIAGLTHVAPRRRPRPSKPSPKGRINSLLPLAHGALATELSS